MKKIICLLICIFTIICCFGCSPSNTVRLKYKIEGNSICFMTPNGESLMNFFGIDIEEITTESFVSITFADSDGQSSGLGRTISSADLRYSHFIIETVYDAFSETLINNLLKKCEFIYVYFYPLRSGWVGTPQAVYETTSRTIFDNQPLKLIKV